MSLIMKMLGQPTTPQASTWTNPDWWGDVGSSVAGVSVSADTALKISTVYACVGLLSETIASLPLVMYRMLEHEQGKERAKAHPLYEVLHDQPNETQTAFQFVEMMMAHALLRGSGYARIQSGRRGFVDQLIPIHPDYITKEKLTNGRIRYRSAEPGHEGTYNQEDIFEVGGLSLDGLNTVSVVSYARDSLGLAVAAERYGGRFFRNDTRPGGALKMPGKLSSAAAKRLKDSWESAHSAGNQHRVAVLEHGLEWQQIGISPDEAQFLETREFQAEDVCRWFRVPPHMVGLTSKATSWGSGIEQMSIGFVTYTLRPWLTRWTQAIKKDLIIGDRYFADFVIEHLLKGDISSRYNAYATARQWGWLSVNDIRRSENMNAIDNGDAYLQPMNMVEADELSPTPQATDKTHYRLLAEEAAGRVVRKEIAAMSKAAKRIGDDREAWGTAVLDFYADHPQFVSDSLHIPIETAVSYATEGQKDLLTNGPSVMGTWQPDRVLHLANLALKDHTL